MPATDYQGSSAFHTTRSFFSFRRDQVHSMESPHSTSQDQELDFFQKIVAEKFSDLSADKADDFLSVSWVQKLLNVFLDCQEEFTTLVSRNKGYLNRAPMDRLVSEFFERSVKALDVCNAIRDGIENIRQWQKQLEIVLCALDNQRTLGEGQFRRAKKALIDLAIGMLDEKEGSSSVSHRNRSFGRNNVLKDQKSMGHYRSLSWSVSRSWSAAKQLQAIGNNLAPPKPNEIMATNGLAVAVYTMNNVLYFVMWALVAAIPCQDRGLHASFHMPKQFVWAYPILSLHEKILDESKKRDKRAASGLMKEIHDIEKCVRFLNELIDCVSFPLNEEKEDEVVKRVKELGLVNEAIKQGLNPMERQVREVFHKIVKSRTEGLASSG